MPGLSQAGNICKHVRAVVIFEQRQQAAAKRRASYEDLFAACSAGCGELVERKGERCYRCTSNEAYRLEIARKRDLVATA